jgi:hypothetical protein
MITRTEALNLYKDLTLNSRADNVALGDRIINSEMQALLSARPWTFLRRFSTANTVVSQQSYELPQNCKMVESISVLSGGFRYTPREVKSRTFWNKLNVQNTTSSTYATWYMIFDGKLHLYPIPSSVATIEYTYFSKTPALTRDDYTTGSIVSATNGSPTITGTGTSWNSSMVGRFIKIEQTDTITSGDGLYYEIASVTSPTVLVLKNNYTGASFTGGTTPYNIGQVFELPDGFQEIPLYRAVSQYWTFQVPDPNRATLYKRKADEMEAQLIKQFGRDTSGVMIEDIDIEPQNPNLYIQSTSN